MTSKLDWQKVNVENDLKYGKPRNSVVHDGFSVNVECRGEHGFTPLLVQGPRMRIPFGLNSKNTPSGESYYCTLSFPGVMRNESGDYVCDTGQEDNLGFFNFMRSIDENNKNVAFENNQWFKGKMKGNIATRDVLNALYYENINHPNDKYAPNLTTKLLYDKTKGEFQTTFWTIKNNSKGEPKRVKIKYEEVPQRAMVIPLLRSRGLWFAGKMFGMSWHVVQLFVFQMPRIDGCIIDIGDGVDYGDEESIEGENGCDEVGSNDPFNDFDSDKENDATRDTIRDTPVFNEPRGNKKQRT